MDIQYIKEILTANPELINLGDDYGNTLLYHSAALNNVIGINLLCSIKGINVNTQCYEKRTACYIACCRNNTQAAEVLINMGDCDVDIPMFDGKTALYCTACCNNVKLIKQIVIRTENINATTDKGETALYAACCRNNTEAVLELINSPNIDILKANVDGKSPYYWAKKHNNILLMKALEKNDIRCRNDLYILPKNVDIPLFNQVMGYITK